jgi:hypothetical protein
MDNFPRRVSSLHGWHAIIKALRHKLRALLVDHPPHGVKIDADGKYFQGRIDNTHCDADLLFLILATVEQSLSIALMECWKTYLILALQIKVYGEGEL